MHHLPEDVLAREPIRALEQDYFVNGVFTKDNTVPPTETNVLSLLSLKHKTAIVAGAAAGIGFAAAEAFAEAGANVALWYNSNKDAITKVQGLAEKHGILCKAYQVDVTDAAAIETALEQSIRDLNHRIDIFVINSGVAWVYGPTIGSDPETFARVLDTNYTSLYRCARAVGPHFKRQTAEKTDLNGRPLQNYTSGSLVATSSLGATREQVPNPQAPYNAAKAAMSAFCRGLAVEWVKFARVNAVSPGYIMTDILAPAPEHWIDFWTGRIPMGRTGKVHEMKGAYLFLASDASTFATGMEMIVDGGMGLL